MKLKLLAVIICGSISVYACGPTGNNNFSGEAQATLDADGGEEEVAALGLTGLPDRICRLDYSFVKKNAAGSYAIVGEAAATDNLPRGGFGRGCINYCLATFDALMAANSANGTEILVKSCGFAAAASVVQPPAPAATPAPAPAPTPAPPPFQTKVESCKVIRADQTLVFAGNKTRSECVAECGKYNEQNPQRRCEWGTEVLRQHPINACTIRTAAGRLLYSQTVNRFQCRMECKARENTNPLRSCVWAGENVKM